MKRILPSICILAVLGIGIQFGLSQTNAIAAKLDDKNQQILQDATSDHWLETFASAFLGGLMAIVAAWIAFKWQIRKEKGEQQEFNLRVLKAICCEVKILREIYEQGSGGMLKKHKLGEPFLVWLHISQRHFTVFESNAEHIGKIDPNLAKRIIVVYELMKLIIEAFGINAHYIGRLEEINSLLMASPTNAILLNNQQLVWNQLVGQTERLKNLDAKISIEADALFKEFEEIERLH